MIYDLRLTIWLKRAAAVALLLSTIHHQLSTAFAQGSLTPPGAPVPTMKSLDQIEARTPISSAPFTITQSGSYYLTTNLICTVSNAIVIAANGVMLDLNGWTISSSLPDAANGGAAILLNSGLRNITIANGFIQGGVTNNGSGVYSGSGFGSGIIYSGTGPLNVRVWGVSISGCYYNGIYLSIANSTVVESCTVRRVGGSGIGASTVKQSSAIDCGSKAIIGDQVVDCRGESSSTGIYATTAANCYGQSSSDWGIWADKTAVNCCGQSSGFGGLFAMTAQNCYGVSSTYTGLSAISAQNCYGQSSSSYGVYAYSAQNCYGASSTGSAINAKTAASCYGVTAGSAAFGIVTENAQGCYGYNFGSGTGLYATRMAIGCYGFADSGTGLSAYIANSCVGETISGAAKAVTYKYNMP